MPADHDEMTGPHRLAAGGHVPIEMQPRVPTLTRWLQRPVADRQDDRMVGAHLDRTVGLVGAVVHELSVPGTDAVIDHVAVATSGLWLIQTRFVDGRVSRVSRHGSPPRLSIDDVDRDDLVVADGVFAAAADWLATLDVGGASIHRALCLVDAQWPLSARPFRVDGVLVTWPRALTDAITGSGMFPVGRARAIADSLRAHAIVGA